MRIFVLLAVAVAVGGAVLAYFRRRSSDMLEYEYHPPLDAAAGADGESQQQIPDYYGGERLGQREGWQQYAARS